MAIGRNIWLFAASLRSGKRAVAVMSLVHSTRLSGHEPYAYLKNVLERLPTHPASRIQELLPHRWQPGNAITRSHRPSSKWVRRTHTAQRSRAAWSIRT
jgi:transposase